MRHTWRDAIGLAFVTFAMAGGYLFVTGQADKAGSVEFWFGFLMGHLFMQVVFFVASFIACWTSKTVK